MPVRTTTIDATLAEVFGYHEFRPHQREIVEHMRRGAATTERFLRSQPSVLGKKRGDIT